MKNRLILFLIPCLLIITSCTNDSESDLIDAPKTETITYTNFVKTVINNNCISCHGATPSNGAPMSLNTYTTVKNSVLNTGLLDRISRSQGDSELMPLGGSRLPQTTIDAVTKWQTDGLLE
ncbi:MAG: hypothetical protein HC854_16935 [Flavobacterium sp.]|nr:hypothetical protein [Flavobacterium sp.]